MSAGGSWRGSHKDASSRSDGSRGSGGPSSFTQVLAGYLSLGPAAQAMVDRNLRLLDEREEHFVRLRFGHDRGGALRTLAEIGELLNVSRQRARVIEARALLKLAHPSMEWPDPVAGVWQQVAEVLLLRVEQLLEQSAELERQLSHALDDVRLARARIRHLEDLNAVLRRELYETGNKSDRRWVGKVATLILGLVGGFLGGVGQAGGEELLGALRNTGDASVLVIQECGLQVPADSETPLDTD